MGTDEPRRQHCHAIAWRFESHGVTAGMALLRLAERWGWHCFLKRLAGE